MTQVGGLDVQVFVDNFTWESDFDIVCRNRLHPVSGSQAAQIAVNGCTSGC